MAKPRRLFVDGRYGQMHLRRAGPENAGNRPLLCAHMFPQSGRSLDAFVEVASADRMVIAPDFPGHGESDAPESPISAEDYAASFWDVVDALNLLDGFGQIDLFGVHAGAKLVAEMAFQRPGDVCGLALSSAAILSPSEVNALRSQFKPVPIDESGSHVHHYWSLLMQNRSDVMTLEMCATALAEMIRHGHKSEWGHRAVFDYNQRFPDVLASLPHRVALLNPRDELYDKTPRSAGYLKNATVFDLPEWGHGYLDVHTRAAAALLLDWLDAAEA